MDLICLAAGKGTRMAGLGRYLQKCMYPVGLRPFLEHTLEQLHASRAWQRAERLALVVGHHEDQVRAYFGEAWRGLPITYVRQPDLLGTGNALRLAADVLEPDASVVAWQADLFVPSAIFDALAEHPAPTAVTLGPGHPGESRRLLASVVDDRVSRVWDGAGPLYDIGAWKLAPDVLARLMEVRAEKGEFRLLPNLQRCIDDGAVVGHVTAREWVHLGGTLPTPEANVRAVVERLWREVEAPA